MGQHIGMIGILSPIQSLILDQSQ